MLYYPVYLQLKDQPVLLVGAGEIALQKIQALLDCQARLHVVAPEAVADIQTFASQGRIQWSRREYHPDDMDGVRLVIAATDDTDLQPRIAEEARRRNIWVNVVDVPPLCDFIAPAIVRKGDIQIAISTGGAAPALAKYLRRKLEPALLPVYAQFVDLVKPLRPEILKLPKPKRLALWECLVSDAFFSLLQNEGSDKARAEILKWIEQAHDPIA